MYGSLSARFVFNARSHCVKLLIIVGVTLVALHTNTGAFAQTVAPGPINYFDATDGPAGNTQLEGGTAFTATPSPVGNDSLWCKRSFGNGATVFTSNDGTPSGGEDSIVLVTTIAGLRPGEAYKIYAYFWSDENDWQVGASLTQPVESTTLQVFSRSGARRTSAAAVSNVSDFALPIVVTEGNRELLQADLGRARADAEGKIRVWIDDTANVSSARRTWYDGIGVAAAPPNYFMLSLTPMWFITIAISLLVLVVIVVAMFGTRRRQRLPHSDV